MATSSFIHSFTRVSSADHLHHIRGGVVVSVVVGWVLKFVGIGVVVVAFGLKIVVSGLKVVASRLEVIA